MLQFILRPEDLILVRREEKEIIIIKSFSTRTDNIRKVRKNYYRLSHRIDCSSIKDLGKLIKSFLKEKYPGQLNMKEVAEVAKKTYNYEKSYSAEEILNEFNNRHKLSDFISKYVQLNTKEEIHILENVHFIMKKHLPLL